MERESEVGKEERMEWREKMTLASCKEFLNLRVVRTCATI